MDNDEIRLMQHLRDSSIWRVLKKMYHHMGKAFAQERHPNELTKMLKNIFVGIVTEPVKPFELKELKAAKGGSK